MDGKMSTTWVAQEFNYSVRTARKGTVWVRGSDYEGLATKPTEAQPPKAGNRLNGQEVRAGPKEGPGVFSGEDEEVHPAMLLDDDEMADVTKHSTTQTTYDREPTRISEQYREVVCTSPRVQDGDEWRSVAMTDWERDQERKAVVHPKIHPEWEYTESGGLTRWKPSDRSEWEQVGTHVGHQKTQLDEMGLRQLAYTLENDVRKPMSVPELSEGPNLRNASAVVEFLQEPFEAWYRSDSPSRTCGKCGGVGKMCPSYQHKNEGEPVEFTCSNWNGHAQFQYECAEARRDGNEYHQLVECDKCDGTGEWFSRTYTREFGPFLSDEDDALPDTPSEGELLVIQQAINGLVQQDGRVRAGEVLEVIEAVVERGTGSMDVLANAMRPFGETETVYVAGSDGRPLEVEERLTEAGEVEVKAHVMTSLNPDISESEARALAR